MLAMLGVLSRAVEAAMNVMGGVSCSGPGEHSARFWLLTPERQIVYRDIGGVVTTIEQPIPGEAALLAADAIRLVVLLDDGGGLRFDRQGNMWRTLTAEGDVMRKDMHGPRFVAGGSGCDGAMWLCDRERRIFSWTPAAGRNQIGDEPVPGSAAILACDLSHRTVLCVDGSRFQVLDGRWVAMPGLMDASGKLKLRALSGVCVGEGRDIAAGEIMEVGEGEARAWLRGGRFEIVGVTNG